MTKWRRPPVPVSGILPRSVRPLALPKKTELTLTNVARASIEELRLDYEDFLRQRSLPLWKREAPCR